MGVSDFYLLWVKPALSDLVALASSVLFPLRCLGCGNEGKFICDCCRPKLVRLSQQRCIACEKPSLLGQTHPGCRSPREAEALVSLLDYHDPKVAGLLIKGKYDLLPGIYRELGEILAREISSLRPDLESSTTCLVPIPLSPMRRRWRGFNQTEALSQAMGHRLGLPVLDALEKKRQTKVQKNIAQKQRRIKNVAGCFAAKPSCPIAGRNIILVDDVVTTGATLREGVKALKSAGAARVVCLTVARD